MVSVCVWPFAVIDVGESDETLGVTTAGLTVTVALPSEQFVAALLLQTRTCNESLTAPGFKPTEICPELSTEGVAFEVCQALAPAP